MMNSLVDGLNLLSEIWWPWTLHAAWQAAIVALVIIGVVRFGRRLPAPILYWLLLLALVKFVVPPMAATPLGMLSQIQIGQRPTAAPDIAMTRPSHRSSAGTTGERQVETGATPTGVADGFAEGAESGGSFGPSDDEITSAHASAGHHADDFDSRSGNIPTATPASSQIRPITFGQPASNRSTEGQALSWAGRLMLIHGFGSLMYLALVLGRLRQVRRLLRAARSADDAQAEELNSLARSLGLRRAVRLVYSPSIAFPFSVGVLRPTIVLPEGLDQRLERPQYQAVLQHELTHHLRGDLVVNWLQVLIGGLWWFHPVMWLLNREIRMVREDCCDDLLLKRRITGEVYCETLLSVARAASRRRDALSLITVSMADTSHPLAGRLRRIMDDRVRRADRLRPTGVAVVALTAALLLPGLRSSDALEEHSPTSTATERPNENGLSSASSESPVVATVIADDSNAQTAQRVDIYGDPLPDGAIARLGTVRYRAFSGSGRIEFLADGRTLICRHGRRLEWMDVSTGRTVRAIDMGVETASLLAVTRDRSLAAVTTWELPQVESDRVRGLVVVDTSSGEIRSRLQFRGETVRRGVKSACFTPDGTQLVTGDYEGVLRIWNVATGREESSRTLPISSDVRRIDFSPDGRWIVACNDRAAYRWEWRTADEPRQFGQQDGRIYTVEFAPDGRTVATGATSRAGIRLYDVESGQQIRQLVAPKRYYRTDQLAFTSDGARLAAPSNSILIGTHLESSGEIDVWDVNSGELLHALPFQHDLHSVAISPDDRWIVANDHSGTIAAWELESGERVGGEFIGHLRQFGTLAVSPDGAQVATAGNEGWVVLWDAKTGRPVHVLQHRSGEMVRSVAFSPDGELVATSALDATIVIWDRSSGQRVYSLNGHGGTGAWRVVRFTPDSRRLLSFADDWFLRVFDLETGKALLEHPIRPSGVQLEENIDGSVNDDMMFFTPKSGDFTPDGGSLVLAVEMNAYVIDVETGAERARYELGHVRDNVALSSDGTRLATLRTDAGLETPLRGADVGGVHSIDVRDLRTGEVEHTITVPKGSYPGLAFSPDGTKLAMSAGVIRVYDIATGRELARIEPETRARWGLKFTPDGRRLAVSHANKTALVWDWQQFLIDEETD